MTGIDDVSLAERLRSFNRFYTEAIGSLDDHHEGLAVSLGEARMLFTAASIDQPQVGRLAAELRLDLAYTSRVLGSLEDSGYVRRVVSRHDRRQRVVSVTAKGRSLLDEVERRSNERMLALIAHLDEADTDRLLGAMHTIRSLLETSLLDKETPRDQQG